MYFSAAIVSASLGRHPVQKLGGVEIKKHYVSYHLIPVYANSALRAALSPALQKRMQGKSCFNFVRVDEDLLAQLDALTKQGYEATAGDPRWGASRRAERSKVSP